MAWTNISKPSSSSWTDVDFQGKEQYDQSTIEYDDSDVYYDSINPNQWTDVAKPAGGLRIFPGYTMGLLIPLTYSTSHDASAWVKVSKPA